MKFKETDQVYVGNVDPESIMLMAKGMSRDTGIPIWDEDDALDVIAINCEYLRVDPSCCRSAYPMIGVFPYKSEFQRIHSTDALEMSNAVTIHYDSPDVKLIEMVRDLGATLIISLQDYQMMVNGSRFIIGQTAEEGIEFINTWNELENKRVIE